MDIGDSEAVVPIINEEMHARAVPVQTGGVRVIKRSYAHNETVEQELHKGRAEVKRVKTNRVVEGPQPVRREGNTTIVPVVCEILKVEKQFVVTEEIHIVQTEESETFRQNVSLCDEEVNVERFGTPEGSGSRGEIPGERVK